MKVNEEGLLAPVDGVWGLAGVGVWLGVGGLAGVMAGRSLVVGVGAGLLLLTLARVLCWQYFLSLLATVRGGTSFLCPTATKKRSKENAFQPRAS